MDHLRISTITMILSISEEFDLKKIYNLVPITKYITFIEYGADNPPKGFSKKAQRKKRKKKVKKIFYNQATIHIFYEGKIMNVKLFNNGRIQITGLKKEYQGVQLINDFINYLMDLSIINNPINIINHKIVLINSDFDIGYEINREQLQNEIINNGIYSTYETCIYPGVNIKYYINKNNFNGICPCTVPCNGKGNGDGNGLCKKVTIAVFKSGKIIITGGQKKSQLEESYRFIKNFIEERKNTICINDQG